MFKQRKRNHSKKMSACELKQEGILSSKKAHIGRPIGSVTPTSILPAYKPAIVVETASKGVHIQYSVLDIETGKYKRYRIMLNKQARYYPTKRKLKEFAQSVAVQLNIKLAGGWTPFGETNNSRFYTPMVSVLEKYLADRKKEVRHATYLTYNSSCKVLTNWINMHANGCRAIDFNKVYALEYMAYLSDDRGVSNKTYNNYLKQMRLVFEWAIMHCYCKEDPFKTIKPRKKEQKKRMVINQDARTNILKYLEIHDPDFLIFLELVFFSLMRPMEIRRCKISQIHLDEHYINIPSDQAKCWRERNAPLSDELVSRLRAYINKYTHAPGDHLFSSYFRPGPKMIGKKAIRKRWERMAKDLNLEDGQTVYSLRDSGIVDMLHAGVDELTVMHAAGHHDLSTTSIYADHIDVEMIERVRKMQVSFAPAKSLSV